MRKQLLFLLGILIMIVLVHPSYAQTGNPLGYEKYCLKVEEIREKHAKELGLIHKRKLIGTGLPINKTIYIVSVTQSITGQIITTGDQSADAELAPFGAKYVGNVMLYVEGSAKMKTSDGNTSVIISVVPKSLIAREAPVQYFGVVVRDIQPTSVDQPVGTAGGLQQGPFTFDILTSSSSSASCEPVQWDPEGRVFDANTLEPIDNVEVTVLDSTKKIANQIGLVNPGITNILGAYVFYVEEGDYYLSVKPPAGFEVITSESQVQSHFSKAYYNVYKKDDLVVERIDTPEEQAQGYPNVEHRDIPLFSSTQKTIRPLSILSHTEMTVEESILYTGQTTHPLTKIILKQGGSVIHEDEADKYGVYSFPVSSSLIDPQSPIDISYEKVDLTTDPITFLEKLEQITLGRVFAQQSHITIRTQPILQKVSGTAFDKNGKAIPYAVVNIRLTNTNAVSIQITADKEGKFSIPDGTTPSFPYYFEFIDPVTNIVSKKETSEFSVNNNSIDTYDKQKAQANIKRRNDLNVPTSIQLQTNTYKSNDDIVLLLGVIFLLLICSIGAYVLYKNKQQSHPFHT